MNEQFSNTNPVSPEGEKAISESVSAATEAARVCPKCETALAEGQNFCPNCGAVVEKSLSQSIVCANCGAEVPSGNKFCPMCGKSTEVSSDAGTESKAGNKKKVFLIGGIIAAVAVIATIVVLCFVFRKIPVEDIVLSESEIELKEEETRNISCTVYPEDATDKTVTWTTSDSSVATVNSYGIITAVGKGSCTITARAGEQSETIRVTVVTKIDFKSIYDEYCVARWARVGSDNTYLAVDTNPNDVDDYYIDEASSAIEKINRELGLPASLREEMGQTSWSMGKQSQTYESIGITVTWTYHPDKGLEVTYKLADK